MAIVAQQQYTITDLNDGAGVANVIEEFYLSTSKTTQAGGEWKTSPPAWEFGKYMWTRSKITYTDNRTPTYTTPVCDNTWEVANEFKAGIDITTNSISSKVSKLETRTSQMDGGIRTGNLGLRLNRSAFNTVSNGSIYLHGYTTTTNNGVVTETETDTNGSFTYKGTTVNIIKGAINIGGYNPNTTFYLCNDMKGNSNVLVAYLMRDSSGFSWKYDYILGNRQDYDISLTSTDFENFVAFGQISNRNETTINNAYLYNTPIPLGAAINSANYEQRISNAEQMITPENITTSVEDYVNLYGSYILSRKSDLIQESDKIVAKFERKGAYNLIRNSTGYGGTKYWSNATVTTRTSYGDDFGDTGFILSNAGATENYMSTYNIPVKKSGKYSISFYAKTSPYCKNFSLLFLGNTSTKAEDSSSYDVSTTIFSNQNTSTNIKLFTATLTVPSNVVQGYFRFSNNGSTMGTSESVQIFKFCVTEGDSITNSNGYIIPQVWTPHYSEIYDGIIKMDKDGIEVTSSNVKSKTTMSSTGFKITKTDTNEDVFKVNADGTLELKGKMIITSGSSVPNSALDSSIVNGATAGLSAKSTIDSNATNWSNAYTRVTGWTSAGTTTIDGGKITASTILADKIAISDFTNYSQLNKSTLTKYGFTEEVVTGNTNWYVKTNILRHNTISGRFTCNGGETFRLKGEVFSQVKGVLTSASTEVIDLETALMIVCVNADGTFTYPKVGAIKNSTGVIDSTITVPSTCREFYIDIFNNGSPLSGQSYMTGTLKVRNIQVTKMASGELIVDGAITAAKLNVDDIFANTAFINKLQATEIRAENITGTLSNEHLNLNGFITFDSLSSQFDGIFDTSNASQTYINGNKILTGSVTADKINTRGLVAKNQNNAVTFEIKEDTGNVVINNALLTSGNFSTGKSGYQLDTNGNVELNQATIRGKVVLPNAGISNDESSANPVRIWAGSDESGKNTAPFRVLQDGSVYATRGNFEGTFSGEVNVGNIKIFDTINSDAYIQMYDNANNKVLSQISGEKDTFFTDNFSIKSSIGNDIFRTNNKNEYYSEIYTYADITLAGDDFRKIYIPCNSGEESYLLRAECAYSSFDIEWDYGITFAIGDGLVDPSDTFRFQTKGTSKPVNVEIMGNLYVENEFKIGNNGMKITGVNDTNGKGYDFIVV